MGFFRFRRKLEPAQEYSIDEIPLFSSLTQTEQKNIYKKARIMECKRGDIIYREGSPSDAFYVIISGRFRMYTASRDQPGGQTMFYLYRGEHFGEASLLTGQAHTVSIEAKRDGMLLKLDRDDFMKFVHDIPALSMHLNRSLGHRLIKSENSQATSREVRIAALYSQSDPEESLLFWLDFSSRLVRESERKVVLVDFVSHASRLIKQEFQRESLPQIELARIDPSNEADVQSGMIEHPNGFHYVHVPAAKEQDTAEKKLGALITFLTYRYDYVMLRLVRDISDVTSLTLKRSDYAYIYCPSDEETLTACSETVSEFQHSFGFSKSEIKVIIPDTSEGRKIPHEEKERLLGLRVFATIPSRHDRTDRYHLTVRYLSRELAGNLVGLALGSGAAYGLAHIGVLKVFERENIPVDVITGASIGAFIGAFWGAGFKSEELRNIAKSITKRNAFFKLVGFRDLSLAHRGFIKGNQVVRFMESYLGDINFQDLKIPLKVIAANLFNSEEVVFEAGRVVDALRASISIPGIFRPYRYRGDYLIDGGVIDPLPVGVLTKMGVKKIIAVNVLSSSKDRRRKARTKERVKLERMRKMSDGEALSEGFKGAMDRIKPHYSVNIFNVIMNTIQFMEYELAAASGAEADVLLHPEISSGHWAQFYTPDKFIKAGEETAMQHLDEIKQLLAE